MIRDLWKVLSEFFFNPLKVFWACFALAFLILVADGSLLRLWGLHRNEQRMNDRIQAYQRNTEKLQTQLELANRPEFVAEKARDRFDLVGEDEMVFVFPSDDAEQ